MESDASARFAELMRAVSATSGRSPAPVDRWNPPDCGEIDIRIDRDGTWFHEGAPIRRMPLIRLFASVLDRRAGRYVLVTPAEMLSITVEDAPFLAVEMASETDESGVRGLVFRTNLDELVRCDAAHPLRFDREAAGGGLRPYIRVRRDLWARLTRSVALELAELVEEQTVKGEGVLGVASGGAFFAMAPATLLDEPT